MKRFLLWALLFVTGLTLGFALALLTVAHGPGEVLNSSATSTSARPAVLVTVSATINGSDRFIFTRDNVWNEHGQWSPPQKVMFNGEAWLDLTLPPPGWADLVKDLDLAGASLVVRKGRDVIALERTADGFELYLADTPMGAANYEATISIPRK